MIEANILQALGIPEAVYRFCHEREVKLADRFAAVDAIAEANAAKILAAFQQHRVEESCFNTTTGYGYDDLGRDTLEAIFAQIFGTEDAIVRPQLICGTHALTVTLFGLLRPGDELLYGTGEPYDTLQGVIGLRPEPGCLKEYGISYAQAELNEEGHPDIDAILAAITPKTKVVALQRSKGYRVRPTLSIEEIKNVFAAVKAAHPDVICMVDNCYGELTELQEPTEVGADICAGSLIKNLGGGLAPIGGYIVGKKKYVELCAHRMSAPGLGKEQGPTLGVNRSFYQGLFQAPTVVAAAVKTAIFAAQLFKDLGYEVSPEPDEVRHDIVQTITFHDPKAMTHFIEGIQAAAPVDAFVTPIAWDMPGYDSQVIMAAGNFISGATIELSADAPLREPYTAFFQGALTWEHGKIGMMKTVAQLGLIQ